MDQLFNDIYQYVSEQNAPVSVQMIAEHLPTNQDKHTINRILIALCRCGKLKRSLKDGKAYYINPDAKIQRMVGEMDANFTKLEALLKDAGIDLHPSNIEDTGFDMYAWTFTKEVRRKVADWSVGIPDGFSLIPSENNLPFEAVPLGQEDVDEEKRKVWIASRKDQPFEINIPMLYSPYARKGYMDVQAAAIANAYQSTGMMEICSGAPDAFTIVSGDVCAFVVIFQIEDGTTDYTILIPMGKSARVLETRISFVTPEQRKSLEHSLVEWVKTFRGGMRNFPVQTVPALSDINLVKQMKHGQFSAFELAVKQAHEEISYSLVGLIHLVRYRINNNIPMENVEAAIREVCEHGSEVAAFYTHLADELDGKLQREKLSSEAMLCVYTKFLELFTNINDVNEINVNGTSIQFSLPDDVKKIRRKWATVVENAKRQREEEKRAEENRRKETEKAEENRRKEAEKAEVETKRNKIRNYIKAERAWENECTRISTERDKLVNTKIEAEKKNIVASAEKEKEDALRKANTILKEQTDRRKRAEEMLASLGIFKFNEKKAQKEIIEDANKQIASAQANIEKANKDCSFKVATADESAKVRKTEFQREAEAEIMLPSEPERPDFIRKQEEQLTKRDVERVKEERQNLRKILDFVKHNAERYHYCTREDIQREFPSVQYSDLTKLTEKGLFERILLSSKLVYLPTDNANQLVDEICPIPKPQRFSEAELEKMASEEMQAEEKKNSIDGGREFISFDEKSAVLNYFLSLPKHASSCTLTDILNEVPELPPDATTARIRRIIDELISDGYEIEPNVVRGRVVYRYR